MVFQHLLNLSPRDRRSAVCLFLYGFSSAGAYVAARTVADSAFLSHIGPEQLAELFMVSAGVVALTSLIYGQFARRFRPPTLAVSVLLLLAGSSAVQSPVLHAWPDSLTAFSAMYLLTQVRGALGTILYATLLTEHFGARHTESFVGPIGFGATLSGILVGTGVGVLATHVDVESLMYAVGVIDFLTIIPVLMLPSVEPTRDAAISASRDGVSLRESVRSGYVRLIAAFVGLGVIVATLVEFEWKIAVAEYLNYEEQAMAAYFGYFYGGVFLLTGVLQLFVTGQILTRHLISGLAAFPALLTAAMVTVALTTGRSLMIGITLAKGCDVLKRSLNDPSVQVLYGPLAPATRRQAIAFVTGVTKPAAEALAAVCLLGMEHRVSTSGFSWIVSGLLTGWLMVSGLCYRGYVKNRKGDPEAEK